MDNEYYTVAELGERLKVSRLTIYRWVKANKLPALKAGKQFRFAKKDVEQFLKQAKAK